MTKNESGGDIRGYDGAKNNAIGSWKANGKSLEIPEGEYKKVSGLVLQYTVLAYISAFIKSTFETSLNFCILTCKLFN